MKITTSTESGVTVVAFAGSLDTASSREAESALQLLEDGGASKVVADLEELDHISSAGLRVLLATAKRISSGGGELRLCSLNEFGSLRHFWLQRDFQRV